MRKFNTTNRNTYNSKRRIKIPAFWQFVNNGITGRFQLAAILFLIAWSLLWFRAFYTQIIIGGDLAKKANRQHMYSEMFEARRGTIYDRNGQVLARSVEARSIYANPRIMTQPLETAEKLAAILNEEPARLSELFARDKAFVWVQRKVSDALVKRIEEAKLEGIAFSREYDRIYPQKHLAGQLIGFVGLDNTGLEGIERSFNKELAGESMQRVAYKDGQGRRYYMDSEDVPQGQDLHLTIDGQIQYIAEEVIAKATLEVEAKWGGVLIVEVATGEIAAWAQYPFFNPNSFRTSSPEIYRNRIATDALEPGSTIKPFPVAAAIEEGIITPSTVFFAENGVWETEYGLTIGDDGRINKDLTVSDIIRYSSNIGMAKIGLELGKRKYQDYLSRLGFGKRTDIGIGESRGILREAWEWGDVDLMSSSFGQSIAVTGVQMAQGYLTLANQGIAKPLKLVMEKNVPPTPEQRIFSTETVYEVMKMLEDVVESDGTGRRARVTGVRVAGKTGTAQKASLTSAGYGEERFASFTGIVPADNPRYVIVIMLDEPQTTQYGGTIAAPIFQEVASRVLAYGGYMPDVVFAQSSRSSRSSSQNSKDNIKPVIIDTSKQLTEFPSLIGANLKHALDVLMPLGIAPQIKGDGLKVQYQFPAPDTPLPLIDIDGKEIPCVLWLSLDEEEQLALEEYNSKEEQEQNVSKQNTQTIQTNAQNTKTF